MAIRKREGRKSPWQVYWNNPITGKRETKSFIVRDDAAQFNGEIKQRLKYEPDSFRPAVELPAPLSFQAVLWDYLKVKQFKPKNLSVYIAHMRSVLPVLANIPIDQIDKRVMKGLELELVKGGIEQNTIKRKVGIVLAVIRWALDMELIDIDPLPRYKCAPGIDKKNPPPTPEELDALLAVAPDHVQRVLILGYYMGARVGPSELYKVLWQDVDFTEGRLRIWSADKNLKTPWRDLKIRAELVPVLQAWQSRDEEKGAKHVINYHGKPVGHIRKSWATALKNAGIKRRIRPYDFRHAFASQALANGADVKAVTEIMGLSSPAMLYRHYQHVMTKQKDHALESIPGMELGHIFGHMGNRVLGGNGCDQDKKD